MPFVISFLCLLWVFFFQFLEVETLIIDLRSFLSSNINTQWLYFPRSTTSQIVDMLCFHFYSILHIFKISFEVSSLIHELFRTVLFNFKVFGTFSVAFLLLVSSLILLWLNSLNNFNSFKFCSLIYYSRYGLSSHIQIQRSKQRSLVRRGGRGNTGIGKWKIQNIECKIGSRMYCTTQ